MTMTPREKRFAMLSGLMALTVLPNMALGWLEGYSCRHALLPPRAALPVLPLPSMHPANLPRLPPLPSAGEEGGLAAGATLYTVRHHGYLMKPPGIQCGSAPMEPILYLPDRHNDGLVVHYRDAGDRWVFDIAATYASENAKAEAVVTVGCNARREAVPSSGPNPPGIWSGRNDREA